MTRNYEYKERGRFWKITKWLWQAAGADDQILKDCTYSDHVKYACLGGIVLGTAVLAFISMFFAMYTIFPTEIIVFKNGKEVAEPGTTVFVPILVGLIWGLIIYNLDRFIISSTGKGDGKDTISKEEAFNALPRLFMALVIGLTISAPLEVYMFRAEIAKKFKESNKMKVEDARKRIEESFISDIERVEEEITTKQKQYENIMKQIEEMNNNIRDETRNVKCGPKCDALRSQLETQLKPQAAKYEESLKLAKDDRDKILLKRDSEVQQVQENLEARPGFLESLLTLEEIEGSAIILWLVRALFMIVEMSPVLFKLMIIKSTYDYLEENAKEVQRAEHGIKRGYIPRVDKSGNIKYDRKGNMEQVEEITFFEAEEILKRRKSLLDAKTELSDKVIGKWKEIKTSDIERNPNDYIA